MLLTRKLQTQLKRKRKKMLDTFNKSNEPLTHRPESYIEKSHFGGVPIVRTCHISLDSLLNSIQKRHIFLQDPHPSHAQCRHKFGSYFKHAVLSFP